MSAILERPGASLSSSEALHASQQAPFLLRKFSPWTIPWPLSLLLNSDAPETWTTYENLFYACLRTGDVRSANECLERLKGRFGLKNERVMVMMALISEALVQSDVELEACLKEYGEVIAEFPTNMTMRKRRIALLKSRSRTTEAAAALVELLEISPIDAEAWAELAELYFLQASYQQSIFSMEEVLLIMPNAWNMHARLAEILYVAATGFAANDAPNVKTLARSVKTFCRSVELCDDYLRGYYGLKLATNTFQKFLAKTGHAKSAIARDSEEDDFTLPSLDTVQKLNELATSKLSQIIRKNSTREGGWNGYEEAEIIAARELLDRDGKGVLR